MKIGIVTTASFSLPLIQFLLGNNLTPFLYIGKYQYLPETEKLLAFAKHVALDFVQETYKEDLYQWTKNTQPDLVIVMGYSHKIQLSKIHQVQHGIYNVHFGKLPAYRGPSPVFWQLKNGDETIGMTIHQLTNKFDEGNIVWETAIKNELHYNHTYLNQIFGELTVNGISFMLHSLATLGSITSKPQLPQNAIYYPKPTFKDVWIQWDTMPATEIINLIRACNDWNVGAFALMDNKWEIKIIDAEIDANELHKGKPGTIMGIDANYFLIKCLGNTVIKVYSITINGVLAPPRHAAAFGLSLGMQFKLTIQ